MKKPIRHIVDYLILSFIVCAAIVFVLLFNGNRPYQIAVIISLSLLYVLWGILHHLKEGSLHPKIFWEYILFAILGTVLAVGLL